LHDIYTNLYREKLHQPCPNVAVAARNEIHEVSTDFFSNFIVD